MRAILLILFAILPTAAFAQLDPSRSGTSSMSYLGGQAGWNELRDFGACYASYETKDALKLVATKPASVEEIETYKQLFRKANQYCLGSVTSLRASSALVRGAIAEGLYKKKIPVPANLAVTTVPAMEQVHNFSDAALCYAAAHRAEALSLVNETKPGSKQEYAAIEKLWHGFAECIPPIARQSVQVDTTLVRFRIAEALWRLGNAPGQAGMPETAK
jgi:hypothetical protein